jgi:ligand-binding SRPBCC domain-containing protein
MRLHAETWVSGPREEVFPFFADPGNLEILTPPWLHFSIRTPLPIEMRSGVEIEYRLRVRGLPMAWVTRISGFEPPVQFVDEQIKGPYRTWVHTHRLVELNGGTQVIDTVEFDLIGSHLIGGFIARDLMRIFSYRHNAVLEAFQQPTPWPLPHIEISKLFKDLAV